MDRFWKNCSEKKLVIMNSICGLLVAIFAWSEPATAQMISTPTMRTWPYSGQWRVSLMTHNGASWCMAQATGHDANGYSFSFMRVAHGMFMTYSEDRLGNYGSTLSLSVDGKLYKSFEAKTSPTGISVALSSGNATEELLDTLGNGQSM